MTAAPAPEEGNVSVVVRVRPPNSREQEGNHYPVVQVVDDSVLVFGPDEPDTSGVFSSLRGCDGAKRKGKDLKFIFDRVFGENATQQDVFEHTTKEILDGVLNGYNCSVFAYGATGAGKTHTMLGTEADPGVMYLTMVELYRRIEAIQEEKSCEVLISYLEVYNEQIQDLLAPKGFLAIREDPQKGVVVQGLSFHQPKSADQLLQMLANGNLNRTQHPTDANASSSRSHAVFQIYVKQQDRKASLNQDVRVAKMSLIDLAGSERASTTNAKGERLREGANINRSLLALINVINALADAKNKKAHIPYRDSKLTRLLKDSIGGNCRTVMIAAISPSSFSYDDTYNTLKYANRAKEIKLSLKSNVVNLDCHISKYAAVCEELRAEVAELRERLRSYETKETQPDALPVCHSPELNNSTRLEEPRDSSSPEQGRGTKKLTKTRSSSQKPLKRQPKKQDSDSENFSFTEEETSLRVVSESLNGSAEGLISALLRVVRKQSRILKSASLQTSEMDTEVQELELMALRAQGDNTAERLCDTGAQKSVKEEEPLLPPIEDAEPDIKPEIAVAPVASIKKRHPVKRCRRELLPDTSPSLRSPVVPAKRRREAESSTPSKAHGARLPSTPEVQVKRPRKSSIPSRGRPNLRSSSTLFPSKSNDATVSQPSKKTSLCTPKQATQAKPNAPFNTIAKVRVPLATSAVQNCASVPPAALAVRDMNSTFDVSEDVFLAPDLNTTVTFGTSEFSGWENVNSQHIDSTFGKSSEVAVFTMNGRSVKLTNSAQLSSVAKSHPHRRRRSNSSSSMRTGCATVGQSKIARLQLGSVKKPLRPPTISAPTVRSVVQASTPLSQSATGPLFRFLQRLPSPFTDRKCSGVARITDRNTRIRPSEADRESCSPQRQSGKKSVKGNTAFGRSVSAAPAARFMQLTAVKS